MAEHREPQPFRPRQAATPDTAREVVRYQLRQVRRRVNAHAAQDVAYRVGAAAALVAGALAVSAVLVGRGTYALIVWGLFASLGVGAFLAVRRARIRWISSRRAALLIDERAHLADRLATLSGARPARSRLWDLLVSQNVEMLPRWEARRVEPYPIPASAVALIIALVLSFLAFRWTAVATAAREGDAAIEAAPGSAARSATGEEGQGVLLGDSELAELLAALPDQIRDAILGSAAGRGERGVGEPNGRPGDASGGEPAGQASTDSTKRPDPSMDPAAGGGPGEGKGGSGGRERRDAPNGETSGAVRGGRAKELKLVRQQAKPGTKSPGEKSLAPGGGGAGAGGGAGDADGLYGNRDGRSPEGAGSFDLDLAGQETAGERLGEGQAPGRADAALAENQRLDDAIRRAQVPPEYEPIVQRLFARDQEPGKEE